MKYLMLLLLTLTGCSSRQINGKQQTFTEYVILNKYSDYKGQSIDDWKTQSGENFPGIRLIKWNNSKEV